MAIDTAAKRRSAAAVLGPPWLPGVTPDAAKPAAWRQQAAWSYSGIEASDEAPALPPADFAGGGARSFRGDARATIKGRSGRSFRGG